MCSSDLLEAGSAPGQPCGTGAHPPAPWATLHEVPTGAPRPWDAVPGLYVLLRDPRSTPGAAAPGLTSTHHPLVYICSPVPLFTTVTHVQRACHHTRSSGHTHTQAAHIASPHHRQGTHDSPEPSHVLTGATCRYDHATFLHASDSVNKPWAPTGYLATPPPCA